MTTAAIQSPYPTLTDAVGKAVNNGRIYIGVSGLDPETNPQAVYWDAALITPAAQPLSVKGGYIVNGASPAKPYTANPFSMRVYDGVGNVVWYNSSVSSFDLPFIANLPTSAGAGLVGFSDSATYPAGSTGWRLKEFTDNIRFWSDFGIVADGTTDDTAGVQAAFDWLAPGKTLFMPPKIKISATVTIGNGTTTTFSTKANNSKIIWAGEGSNANALIDTSDPQYAAAYSGTQFIWAGADGGVMMKIAGPIQGLRWIGNLTLNGKCMYSGSAGAGYCLEAKSFSSCIIDSITAVNWKASGRGVLFSTVDSTGVGTVGANSVLSGGNQIGRVFAFSPYGHNGECMKLDGYKVAGGNDFTVSGIGIIQCGVSGTGAKGLVLSYTDDITINQLVNTPYGAISGSPYGLYLLGTSTPFEAPARVRIIKAAVGAGLSVGGGTNAQVVIDEYELDDAAILPSANGLYIRHVIKTGASYDMIAYPYDGKTKSRALGDYEGHYLQDVSGNTFVSTTRRGNSAHVAGYADVEFEAGATGGPTATSQAKLTTARLSSTVPMQPPVKTVATLPTGAAGDRAFVTDATVTTYASAVVGGGANSVPVYYASGAWRIG